MSNSYQICHFQTCRIFWLLSALSEILWRYSYTDRSCTWKECTRCIALKARWIWWHTSNDAWHWHIYKLKSLPPNHIFFLVIFRIPYDYFILWWHVWEITSAYPLTFVSREVALTEKYHFHSTWIKLEKKKHFQKSSLSVYPRGENSKVFMFFHISLFPDVGKVIGAFTEPPTAK